MVGGKIVTSFGWDSTNNSRLNQVLSLPEAVVSFTNVQQDLMLIKPGYALLPAHL